MTRYRRHVTGRVLAAMADTPVVAVNGPRQSGKSTLVNTLALPGIVERVSMDDEQARSLAAADPRGFVERPVDTLVVDEVQLEPRLFRAIKAAVDRDRRPGRFLITGSARLLSAPDMADSLVGRVETIDLWPLSQGELRGTVDAFVDLAFDRAGDLVRSGRLERAAYVEAARCGGFPEAVARAPQRRGPWFEAYATTIVQRVVSTISDIERLAEIPRLVRLCAARSAGELNVASISRDIGIPAKTVDGYLALLSNAFVVTPLPAWSTNISAKVVRAPKLHLVDPGLAGHLIGAGAAPAGTQPPWLGPLVETFVVSELRRQLSWSAHLPTMWHFRDRGGAEVDVVLEHPDGRVVGIEVKASSTVTSRDFRGLTFLRERLGARFHLGVVLSAAPEATPAGDRLVALPISALWEAGGRPEAADGEGGIRTPDPG